ncbi:Uncharacterized protein YmfQ in lambdoid prophage, DUF2313 family [Caballeronia arationis]|uniref:Uncharacterized protein YmfQ in lambdoid prophage, DUF2313 family n=1 Tax=Caballeronia arationis TaxID=1777142 RepID=A0A7Z7IAU6_9BURK|nr:putative phage tail protein [Caballeronia arationis]SOE82102.1 Uncharacterized protein YmfQ in lambdoid prophage, DUF2313 family [Caballeronia arationis]
MAAPVLLAANFLSAIQALLPRGVVWPRDQDAVQTKGLTGLAPTYERNTSRANYLLTDSFPATTYELLPEWEETLGLPDPCAGESPTIQARRAQVVARFANSGGQSAAYFIQFASNLGYEVTIENFGPARAGQARCGDPDYGQDWAFAWAVDLPLNTITYARAGQATAGEPLQSWGNDVLQCEFEAISPAHTIVIFRYLTEVFDNSIVSDDRRPVITSNGYAVIL